MKLEKKILRNLSIKEKKVSNGLSDWGNTMKSLIAIDKILKKYKPELEDKYKVKEIGIFGSYARGEQRRTSDLDVLVEFSEPIGWEFVDLKEYLESILDMKVDLVTVRALKPQIKDKILQEVIYL